MKNIFLSALALLMMTAAGCRHAAALQETREPEITEMSLSSMPTEVEEEKALKLMTGGFYVTAQGSPAEWARRFARPLGSRLFFVGLDDKGRADEIRDLANHYDELQRGLNWNRVPEAITIPRLAAAPALDGVVSDAKYGKAAKFKGEYPMNSEEYVNPDGITWYLGWYGDNLYAAARVKDSTPFVLNGSTHPSPSWDRFYKADCIELFIRPWLKSEHYYEFVVNMENNHWCLDHVMQDCGFWRTINRVRPSRTRTAARKTAEGYEVEFEIPLCEFIEKYLPGEKPQAGDIISLMMIHIDAQKFSDATAPRYSIFPQLYEGHNIFGYAIATLGK